MLGSRVTVCLICVLPECTYKHHTTIDDEPVAMEILDTAGQVGVNHTVYCDKNLKSFKTIATSN